MFVVFNLIQSFTCDENLWVFFLFGMQRKWLRCMNCQLHIFMNFSVFCIKWHWPLESLLFLSLLMNLHNLFSMLWMNGDTLFALTNDISCNCAKEVIELRTFKQIMVWSINMCLRNFLKNGTYRLVSVAEDHHIDQYWIVHYTEMQLNRCICCN